MGLLRERFDEVGIELNDPRREIRRTLAGGLGLGPQFEVLGAIVMADAVDVVRSFEVGERPAEGALKDEPMGGIEPLLNAEVDVAVGVRRPRVLAAEVEVQGQVQVVRFAVLAGVWSVHGGIATDDALLVSGEHAAFGPVETFPPIVRRAEIS